MFEPTHPNYVDGGIGVLANRFMGDPRINKKQMAALEPLCKADNKALVLGLDEHHRMVVRGRVGIPREPRTWAVMRNGDPTDAGRIFNPFHTGEPTPKPAGS